jgi:putative transposase
VIGQIITEAHAEGLTVQKACAVIGLSPRTLQRWRTPAPAVATVPVVATPATPRPRPHNALTEREAATVVALIQSAHHADASCRELALALEQGPFPTYVSHVTIWAYQCALHCNGPRGRQGPQGRRSTAPDTTWVNGPNRLWDWDVTFLATSERSRYLYLYSLLDHWSRKNIAWLIGEQFTSTLAQTLWDQGLIQEGLLDQPTSLWPKSLSDRGAQMRSHSTKTYFQKLGIGQLHSRPRTPNDNPFIESHFATIKTQPAFPGYFADQVEAEGYFRQFYAWYNQVHPHTRLKMLTPSQVHTGQGPQVLAERARLKMATLAVRSVEPHVRTFTVEKLAANPLPNVSAYPCYSWAGVKIAPANQATPLD